ncbi:hypothetical protein HMPREF9233_01697 [Actinobaculum massiliense ACS-171-V-Col2]|uniref:Uncharacterized protein n=1 Tax=Actinobaculum massiliense ACS-171-V-Col2 TaxID=883066 RepID=K9EZT2_9ACTO|nr:hypothetical protein HMPREF9233_01697 [Actinobaculum massiliense ACS-171-V-Col2]
MDGNPRRDAVDREIVGEGTSAHTEVMNLGAIGVTVAMEDRTVAKVRSIGKTTANGTDLAITVIIMRIARTAGLVVAPGTMIVPGAAGGGATAIAAAGSVVGKMTTAARATSVGRMVNGALGTSGMTPIAAGAVTEATMMSARTVVALTASPTVTVIVVVMAATSVGNVLSGKTALIVAIGSIAGIASTRVASSTAVGVLSGETALLVAIGSVAGIASTRVASLTAAIVLSVGIAAITSAAITSAAITSGVNTRGTILGRAIRSYRRPFAPQIWTASPRVA